MAYFRAAVDFPKILFGLFRAMDDVFPPPKAKGISFSALRKLKHSGFEFYFQRLIRYK